jgi:GT2 family glycosyltransferase
MISIIISTHKPDLLDKISSNINKTIGVEYEIIAIENHKKYSLCEAYNIGSDMAKFNYLCFVHEDVIFLNKNWGSRLLSIMNIDKNIGLIGIAGSKFKSTYPNVGWGTGPYIKNLYKGHLYLDDDLNEFEFDQQSTKQEVEDVVCLDGLFLFTKKEVYEKCRFDDKLLNGFHGYDTDFSLQVFFESYRVVVDRGTSVIHYSPGCYNYEYAKANRKIIKKWLSKLPVASKDLKMNLLTLNYYNIMCWLGYLRNMVIRKLHLPFNLK